MKASLTRKGFLAVASGLLIGGVSLAHAEEEKPKEVEIKVIKEGETASIEGAHEGQHEHMKVISSSMLNFPVADDERANNFDWLQIYTGEWVRGQFVAIYSDAIGFNSLELGSLTFPVTEVRALRTRNDRQVKLKDGRIFTGRVLIREGRLYMLNDQDRVLGSVDFADVLTVAPTNKDEWMLWSGGVDFGATFRTGNTESVDYAAQFDIERRSVDNLFWFRYLGAYSEVSSTITEANHRFTTSFDIFSGANVYYRPIFGEVLLDKIQNINYRATATSGGGYFFVKNPRMRFSTGAAIGGQYTEYEVPTFMTGSYAASPVFQWDVDFFWQVGPRLEHVTDYVLQVVNERSGELHHFLTTGFDFRVNATFGLGLDLIYNRVKNPARQQNLRIPDPSDTRVDLTMFYRF